MKNDNIISVNNLTKKFGNFTAVNEVSFEIRKGEIFGFLGANGAGKTTCMKMLCGLLQPTSGSAKIANYDLYKESEKIKLNIGYMSQKFSLYADLTVKENIEFYGGIYKLSFKEIREKTDYLLNKLGLYEVRNKLIASLPLGWKQKLAFSTAIIHDPKIVFLDEPTSGVDPIVRRQFWELIYEASANGITVFVTTHYMDEAEYCERVSIMHHGKIEALDTAKNLKEKYQVDSVNDVFLKIVR